MRVRIDPCRPGRDTGRQHLIRFYNAIPHADETDFTTQVAAMVADQAPHLFAIVLEYGEQADAQVIAWGMAHDESAYVTTVDGKNQYLLMEPENALKYVPSRTGTTPHLVWATPSTPTPDR